MVNSLKSILASGLVALVGLGQNSLAQTKLEQRLVYTPETTDVRSQTIVSGDGYKVVGETFKDDAEAGLILTEKDYVVNLAVRDKEDLQSTRTNVRLGNPNDLAIGVEYHTAEAKEGSDKDFLNGYVSFGAGNTVAELDVNTTDKHVTGLTRTTLDKDNSLGLATTLSDAEYQRAGVAFAHSGTVGLFGYAIEGKDNSGNNYHDIRVRGGVGGKTSTKSMCLWSVDGFGFFDEDLLEDLEYTTTTGPFNNLGAHIRGNPVGFDARLKNGTAYLEVALTKGPITFMPKFSYDTVKETDNLQTEVHADLGRGLSAKYYGKFMNDTTPETAFLLGYQATFGGKK
ncbi:hypothetical protein KA107_02475 [Candidatus Pacearchaeota archaeon]|nr:hypothetical protein [Candidatus Pacearchaeota archaeon]